MKLATRFFLPLFIVLVILALAFVPLVENQLFHWFNRDLNTRSRLISTTINQSLNEFYDLTTNEVQSKKIANLLESVALDERLVGIGLCDTRNSQFIKTQRFPTEIACFSGELPKVFSSEILRTEDFEKIHVSKIPVLHTKSSGASLIIIHNMSFIETRNIDMRKYLFLIFLVIGLVVSFLNILMARLSLKGWVASVRKLVSNAKNFSEFYKPKDRTFLPIVKDLRKLLRELESNKSARDITDVNWSATTLKSILKEELTGEEVIVVSNRQPYTHIKRNGKIETLYPASGLVTGVEPILRACSGVWVAHGSGDADKEVVDENDNVPAPPDDPAYVIHRVWLTEEEEKGYYYGFANEGLWPLCHIAHTRPIFRVEDWEQYVAVNQKFADAVVKSSKSTSPVVLVQDYHLALAPAFIRKQLPRAIIITFWHIPWPNPETFGICPWREEIIEGLLGSSIIGFHTQFHCNNFFDAVDRYLESRIDREFNSVIHKKSLTAIRTYPISLEWPPKWLSKIPSVAACRKEIFEKEDLLPHIKMGIGVDRLDYTKGIVERFLEVERLLTDFPKWIGEFTFIQIAAPSRSSIESYKNLEIEVRALAERINDKFGNESYKPIILKIEHHGPESVFKYYRAADICLVTSLHDGMNLVAKEFVAARDDESGVLILSTFAGASKELTEALIVNPYDLQQCAEAISVALEMDKEEKRERMRYMRAIVKEYNIFRWAGRMLKDAADVRSRNRFFQFKKKRAESKL